MQITGEICNSVHGARKTRRDFAGAFYNIFYNKNNASRQYNTCGKTNNSSASKIAVVNIPMDSMYVSCISDVFLHLHSLFSSYERGAYRNRILRRHRNTDKHYSPCLLHYSTLSIRNTTCDIFNSELGLCDVRQPNQPVAYWLWRGSDSNSVPPLHCGQT